jgi:hypothetical protein
MMKKRLQETTRAKNNLSHCKDRSWETDYKASKGQQAY